MNLVRYDAACRALADAKAVDEVMEIHNRAEAMRAYAVQSNNRALEIDAAEIRIRAERRLGELLIEQDRTIGLHPGGRPRKTPSESAAVSPDKITLREVGINYKQSARAQQLAAVPPARFESMVDDWRGRVQQETERVTKNLLREGERAQTKEARPHLGMVLRHLKDQAQRTNDRPDDSPPEKPQAQATVETCARVTVKDIRWG